MENKKPEKRVRIGKYLDLMGFDVISISIIADLLYEALRDKTTHLLVSENEYQTLKRWFIHNGQWDWDGESFMTMKIVNLYN